jgi:hypothetical protein
MKGELVLGVDFQKVTAEAKPRSAGQPRTAKPAVAQTRYEHLAEGMIERL